MDVALIGCGFIGTLISNNIAEEKLPVKLKLLLDRNADKVKRIQSLFDEPPASAGSVEEILSSNVDLVIEAASMNAVYDFALPILDSGKDMMIMSVGAFSDPGFYHKAERLCNQKDVKIYLPTGAVGGLDAVSSASMGELDEVVLTTTKNPSSLEGAPYLAEHNINLSKVKEPTVVFSGSAIDAIQGFPANVNVAIALSLAGVGSEKTQVKIVADPGIKTNIHEIVANGEFGVLRFRTENIPSPENPRTSLLAALSAISTLKKITHPIKIG